MEDKDRSSEDILFDALADIVDSRDLEELRAMEHMIAQIDEAPSALKGVRALITVLERRIAPPRDHTK